MMTIKCKSFLVLLAVMMLVPQGVKAEMVSTYYNFRGSVNDGNTTTEFYDDSYDKVKIGNDFCTYFRTIGNVSNPNRFATNNVVHWSSGYKYGLELRYKDSSKSGLFMYGSNGNLVITKLFSGDKVIVTGDRTFELAAGSTDTTKVENNPNNTFTMKATGSLALTIPSVSWIYSIEIQHDNSLSYYAYDPAIEVYDFSSISAGTVSYSNTTGFNLNGNTADYLVNTNVSEPNYLSINLNNRIAVEHRDNNIWTISNGGLIFPTQYNALTNFSICNLRKYDRVRVTYEDGTSSYGYHGLYFGSDTGSPNELNSAAFKDTNNDGEQENGEPDINRTDKVDASAFYTMKADGHLDFVVMPGAIIKKIEIYSDHQAIMLDRDTDPNNSMAGSTSYFSSTGQLIAKEHIVPGGLNVYVGNNSDTQHAEVVSSDEGPVSFVYDQDHFKMARHASFGSVNVWNELPVTGTYYRFVPEVNGKVTVKFKANSINYWDYNKKGNATGNEVTNGALCPYYFMVEPGDPNADSDKKNRNNLFSQITSTAKNNGATVTFSNQTVERGKSYYLYGWWSDSTQWNTSATVACGVAELIEVSFVPDNMVTPLAKSAPSGTTSDADLATVSTSSSALHIKKMSGSITGCEPYIHETSVNNKTVYKLGIRNITFDSDKNPGGTILIKVGDVNNDNDPVFAYTIAYDAAWNNGEGHKWDFSDAPLNGLKWNNKNAQADVTPFKTSTDTDGLLYQEMHEISADGSAHSDWTFAYRVNLSGGGGLDPMFLNKYAMEGDNADMMWDTEGLIIKTASNQSCINNEYKNSEKHDSIDHNNTTNRPDPDRFVGILPGGEFRIPNLNAGDRVVIYMGSGSGSGTDAIYMDITNAKDAVGTPINDINDGNNGQPIVGSYRAGGSLWQADSEKSTQKHGTPYYKGAYHFIAATDGDMIFKLQDRGTLTKLYSIEIYTGNHRHTNDLERAVQTYNGTNYNLNGYQFFNRYSDAAAKNGCFSMHWRGKGEGLSEPVVLHHTGNVSYDSSHLFHGTIGTNHFIFYKSEMNQFGLLRIRVDVKDLNGTYATDYGLQNVVVGCLSKKPYPYTWDFTDLMGYAYETNNSSKPINQALASNSSYNESTEFMDNAVVQWQWYNEDTGDYANLAGYGLNIMNSAFSGEMVFPGSSQLYAGNQIIAETEGIEIIQQGTEEKRNGRLRISNQGLSILEQKDNNWRFNIPEVPATAAVYVRAKPIPDRGGMRAHVGNASTDFSYIKTIRNKKNTADSICIYAAKGTGADMTLYLANMIVEKIAVATDAKTVNKYGWNTESREHPIDPSLLPYMTGKDFRTYIVTSADKENNTVTLARIDGGNAVGDNTAANMKLIVPGATKVENEVTVPDNGSINACIIRYVDDTVAEDAKEVNLFGDGSGFHLFVPDMHDAASTIPSTNLLKARVTATTDNDKVARDETVESKTFNNYAFTYQYRKVDDNGNPYTGQKEGVQAFYRIVSGGARSGAHKAYLSIEAPASSRASSRAAASSQSAEHYDILFQEWDNIEQMKGDVNGDGRFNKLDVNTMADYVAGRPAGIFKGLADMNDDGNIDIVDMTLMIKKITGE